MILNGFNFVEDKIILSFQNERRREVCLLRVYDYDYQVMVTRRDIQITPNGKAIFPISYLLGDQFHDGVKYVLNVQEDHEIKCGKVFRLNAAFDIYIYVADNKKITFELKSTKQRCELVGILDSEHEISFEFSGLSGAQMTKLLLKRRVANKFWQYHDCQYAFDLNCTSISLDKRILNQFFLTRPQSLWDFFIRNEFPDGSFYDSYVYHEGCSLTFNGIRIYVGFGKTLILRKLSTDIVQSFVLDEYKETEEKIQIGISCVLKSQFNRDSIKSDETELIICSQKNFEELNYQQRQSVRFTPTVQDGEKMMFELPIGNFLSNKYGPIIDDIQARENLQFFIRSNGNCYPVTVMGGLNTIQSTYLPVNSRLQGRIYIKDQKLYLYTHTGSFHDSRKIEVAVFGTCFTRNIFRSTSFFNENYKIWYSCGFTQFHSTLISLASKPYYGLDQKLINMERVAKKYLELDFHKNYVEHLKSTQPKYILIDLYCDATIPTLLLGESYISINLYNRYSSILDGFENKAMLRQSNWDEYFRVWKRSMKIFISSLKELVPEKNIILVRSRFALDYKDADGSTKNFSNQWKILKDNLVWDRLEESLLMEFTGIRTIDMRECHLVADKHSPLGFSPSHFESEYYNQCLIKFNGIVLEDLIRDQQSRTFEL